MPPPRPAPASGGAETPAPPDWYAHGLNRVGYYRLATAAAGALPRPARLLLARGLGRLFARAVPAERRAVRSNLSRVLAGARPEVIEARVSETFANFGAFFADLRSGRTAHVVLSAEQDRALERYLRLDGPRLRFVTRHHATSTLGLLAALRRAELVAMQADRPTGGRGDAMVSFFGEPAAFPLGPFLLARAAGAAVVPAFCVMAPGGRYRLEIEPAIWVKPGEEQAGLATMVGALERVIRAYPTQWFNFFDAWSPPLGRA